ncbi:MAG: excinuclease ABC subunit UvrA [Acidobacteria bacterium]|nr:excinuclease ABC subunit UvrA [Acidobacteriota bacterium]
MAIKVEAAPRPGTQTQDAIRVRGARVHNLKNIDVDIPHNAITVVTGVSGSGKSSLAFDTLYAEGQRRYIESLSAYARQFLERIEKPDVTEIIGIAPAIAIKQKNASRNPRSTVATATEIYDYLRLLYARIGTTYCHQCSQAVERDTIDQIAARLLALPTGTRFYVLFRVALPVARGRKRPDAEELNAAVETMRRRGFTRLYQEGRLFELSQTESLPLVDFRQPVFALVDRLTASPAIRARLVDSMETAYREGHGEAWVDILPDQGVSERQLRFSERFECRRCSITYEEPEPRLFSFNNPFGACPRCQGFGNTIDFDLARVIPDPQRSLAGGAIEPWTKPRYRYLLGALRRFARRRGIPLDQPWAELTAAQRNAVIKGDEDFLGVKGFFAYLERKKYKLHVRVFLSRYRGYTTCPACQGQRLRLEARCVRVADQTLPEVCQLSIGQARAFFERLTLTANEVAIAEKILEEIRQRLRFLDEVGLDYITLDRLTSTLAGGEAQRIQLATTIGSRLVGALYVLDEPSIGLHARDVHRLIDTLKSLRELGNTILVVEHDPEMIRAADFILDLGPGAGEEGGRLIFQGTYSDLLGAAPSLTGRYLAGELRIPVPSRRRRPGRAWLRVRGCTAHNLKQIDVEIPLGLMVAVSGVSGSGKSTLVHDVLYHNLSPRRERPNASHADLVGCRAITGDEGLANIVLVDQSPIGRTPRSNPVTYVKAFDAIRELFAATPEAKKRGYTAGHFSFNISGGRCETCQGAGTVTVEMQFLADVELICEECKGTRFKSGVLDVHYRGKSIHEVLNLTVHEALAFFAAAPKVVERLRLLDEVGLGYLRLGQSATTLSGGEAQRLKLAAHLARSEPAATQGTLYIFDEPTTGLHFDDIQKLLGAFRRLLEAGATVLIIEHNLEVIKAADWIIDLGPEGGEEGGRVVVTGTPEQVAHTASSYTGRFLARVLSNHRNAAAN